MNHPIGRGQGELYPPCPLPPGEGTNGLANWALKAPLLGLASARSAAARLPRPLLPRRWAPWQRRSKSAVFAHAKTAEAADPAPPKGRHVPMRCLLSRWWPTSRLFGARAFAAYPHRLRRLRYSTVPCTRRLAVPLYRTQTLVALERIAPTPRSGYQDLQEEGRSRAWFIW